MEIHTLRNQTLSWPVYKHVAKSTYAFKLQNMNCNHIRYILSTFSTTFQLAHTVLIWYRMSLWWCDCCNLLKFELPIYGFAESEIFLNVFYYFFLVFFFLLHVYVSQIPHSSMRSSYQIVQRKMTTSYTSSFERRPRRWVRPHWLNPELAGSVWWDTHTYTSHVQAHFAYRQLFFFFEICTVDIEGNSTNFIYWISCSHVKCFTPYNESESDSFPWSCLISHIVIMILILITTNPFFSAWMCVTCG